ncbi:hypothetical protein NMY22_g6960 [Coprinellus aureogranulatus]|nr:hypothetical protein NMY22_g6960 [Coprinellus aureogranulatus]
MPRPLSTLDPLEMTVPSQHNSTSSTRRCINSSLPSPSMRKPVSFATAETLRMPKRSSCSRGKEEILQEKPMDLASTSSLDVDARAG